MNKPLRVVHTESSCGWGGQEIRILTEAQAMLQRGHRVVLLCPAEAPIHTAAGKYDVPVEALPIARKNWRGFWAMRQWLKNHPDWDVIDTHSSTDSWLVALACASRQHAPVIVRTRHVSSKVFNNRLTAWLYRHGAHHVVTTGEALRQQLHRENTLPLSHLTSVPTGIDLTRFVPGAREAARAALGLEPNATYLGIVATLRSWKGHEYLLDALARLVPDHPDLKLLIVGDGPQRENLACRIAKLGLTERVTMAGQRDDVPLWLNALDVFVLPSYGEEGVPQAIMQAMACGIPVVSTTVGAIGEAVADGETGILVAPRDTDALYQALASLVSDFAMRNRMGKAGLACARQRFGIVAMLDKMEAVFYGALKA